MRVALYVRVSTEEQAERYGIDLQKTALMGLIKSRGQLTDGSDALILAGDRHIYVDEGVSGTIPLDERPAFSRLKEEIVNAPAGSKPFDIVAVFKIDRFARRLKILLDVIDFFEDYEIGFLSANESIDTSTPFGKAILGIIGVIAELELENIKLRTKAGREEAIKQGKVMGPVAPYGFKKDEEGRLQRFEPEAQIVERIFHLFKNEGKSAQAIAAILTKEKILSPAPSGALHRKRQIVRKKTPNEFWRGDRIMRTLKDERYIGNYYYNRYAKKGILKPREEWKLGYRLPQIIDPLTFEKAQKLLVAQKHQRRTTHSDHTYLLSGLLQCDACSSANEKLTFWSGLRQKLPRKPGEYSYYYQCGSKNPTKSVKHCGTLPLPAAEIEGFILAECIRIVNNPQAVYENQKKLASTQAEMKHLKKQQGRLLEIANGLPRQRELLRQQHQEGIIDLPKLKSEIADLENRERTVRTDLDGIEEKLSRRAISQGYAKGLDLFAQQYAGDLNEIKNDRQKSYDLLHALIDSIVIYSRPVTENDKIAGHKKQGQQIPNEIMVKLKLPQDLITENLIMSSHQNALNRADGRN